MKTKNCFQGDKYYYRDSDIDSLLPEEQDETIGTVVSNTIPRPMTFKEIYGYNPETFSLVEIEKLINEDSKQLLTNGYENFFPVKSKDGVSVMRVRRYVSQWRVSVDRLDYDYRWYVGGRFFSKQLLTLGNFNTSLEDAIAICKKHGLKVIEEK